MMEITPIDEKFLPNRVKIFSGERTVCYMEYEAYDSAGGPEHYHDCCVFAFYAKSYDKLLLESAISQTCQTHQYAAPLRIDGLDHPSVKQPWLTKWGYRLFGR